MTQPTIYIRNASTLVTDAQVATMTRACAYQARFHLAPDWGLMPTTVLTAPAGRLVAARPWVITIYDDSDQAGTLGYHTEEDGVVYGRVFARPSLDNGSQVFTGPYAVSSVLSHEVLETVLDPSVNRWAVSGTDKDGVPIYHSLEACDAVEDGVYTIRDLRTVVTVSNFLLPAWADAQNTRGPFDYLGKLTAPFTRTAGGYEVIASATGVNQVFGEQVPAWRRDQKRHPLGRGARRAGITHESALHEPGMIPPRASLWARMTGRLR